MSATSEFAAWFYQRAGEAQTGEDQTATAPESVAPSYPVVTDAGELQHGYLKPTAQEQFVEWFDQVL